MSGFGKLNSQGDGSISSSKRVESAERASHLSEEVCRETTSLLDGQEPSISEFSEMDYSVLAVLHTDILKQNLPADLIAKWLGTNLGIESWRKGEFLGELNILPTPKPEEMLRLQKFVEAIKVIWTKANGPSRNHPQYLLLDGYVQNELFGTANMAIIDKQNDTFEDDWFNMGENWENKTQYLQQKTGLNINIKLDEWSVLTGNRDEDGHFGGSDRLFISGTRTGLDVRRLGVNLDTSDVRHINASFGYLCALGSK